MFVDDKHFSVLWLFHSSVSFQLNGRALLLETEFLYPSSWFICISPETEKHPDLDAKQTD